MPRLEYSVSSPPAGAAVGRTVTMSGLARVVAANSGKLLVISIDDIRVEFGAGGPVVTAGQTGNTWSASTLLPSTIPGGTSLRLTATLRGTNQFDVGIPGEPAEPGPEIPFETSLFVDVQVAVSPAPGFALTEPANGQVVNLGAGGGQVDVALTLQGEQFYPVTINISADGKVVSQQITGGTQFRRTIDLAPMPLGARPVAVTAANRDRTSAAQTRTVTGRDVGVPDLEVVTPVPHANIIGNPDGTAVVPMTGTAPDPQSGMVGGQAKVEWALSLGGSRTPATPGPGNDFSSWTANVPVTGFGAHSISVWATDNAGNTALPVTVPVTVISSFVPADLDERLSEREYLAALLSFAQEQVTVPGPPPAPLDTATLVGVLGQPVDRLSQPLSAAADLGGRPVNQLRVPLELLRARIAATHGSTPRGTLGEAEYRDAAYATLLATAGTSTAELRLARGADPAERQALAARLGIRLSTTTPDELGLLLLDGPARTEAALESLFGLPTTIVTDPLREPAMPLLLTWRLKALALSWAEQDQHPTTPPPFAVLADPDVVGAADVVADPKGDPIRALLTQRAGVLSAYANQLDQQRTGAPDAAKGMAAILGTALPGADLAALETRDRQGGDIAADLRGLGLTRTGFLNLRRATRLAATGPLTPAEWADAIAVLVGAHKSTLVAAWLAQETGFVLSPDFFTLSATDTGPVVNPLRVDPRARAGWRSVLRGRVAQRQDLIDASAQAVSATEQATLPILRDALLAHLLPAGSDDITEIGEALSGLFLVDVLAAGALRTTRIRQAVESVQSLLSAKRSGELVPAHPAFGWQIEVDVFTAAWVWMGELGSWQAATMAFLFPERHLDPTLLVPGNDPPSPLDTLFTTIRGSGPFSAEGAVVAGRHYLDGIGVHDLAYLNPQRSLEHQRRLRDRSAQLPEPAARAAFWVVPLLLAQRLQSAGDFRAALDWYWIVYPYDVADPVRSFHKMNTEQLFRPDLTFPPGWTTMLDPFALIANRPAPYNRYTLLAVIRCHLDFADAEFTRETDESIANARTLYVTARRLLDAPVFVPQLPVNHGEPALPIPELDALRARARVQLAKLRQGRNIAGMPRTQGITAQTTVRQPTPLRFKTLLERARQLTAQASQIEAGYLAALEKYDERGLRLFDALKGVDLSAAQVTLAVTRVKEATDGVAAAVAQRDKADVMAGTYTQLIDAPPNRYEQDLLDQFPRMRDIRNHIADTDAAIGVMQAASNAAGFFKAVQSLGASVALGVGLGTASVAKGFLENSLNNLDAQIQANQLQAGIEQRRQDWRVQQTAAEQEALVAAAQVVIANDQVAIADQEQVIANLQHDQSVALVRFLNAQFTNADLYQWMSNTLGGVYRYFLQQATATARLAQAQLAFERAEAEQALIRNDYWQPPQKAGASTVQIDRRGLTGAEQLTADVSRLEDYALHSERRRLNLSQTFSLARLMPVEFLEFRRTGTLSFATPMALFDNDFPGHYLRMIRQVRTSVVALVPPDRGIRATLYSNGISRVITGQDGTFGDIVLRHDPTIVALTSPINASGVFELDTQTEVLLPFESSGVDTTWELQLPPAANPFDFDSIADVLVTVEYTALHDENYRSQVTAKLNTNRERGADRVFSLAQDFPDQWYDLNNTIPAGADRRITVPLRDVDFPFGVEALSTAAVAVRLVGGAQLPDVTLTLTKGTAGGAATVTNGLAGTRRGNAPAWLPLTGGSPAGEWQLAFGADAANLFAAGALDDILLMISWAGQGPAWTA
ncbi:neuraminidase-like domain-containing protein [Dactylosporangium siamense]|uniref:Tc toxin complex TcA C-terminal TcB-binding domain-containing protein n=1 Tax=Dactylosporangium siamense TaxID=685454 RepID=A0A919PU20_9ACTN|nr:neuraminidase-like domain-containing protein [Dactylosporangium siamense]GIG50551.1 hypothetical protein Dsi01nite_085920 [Dactylosporangium siamense]